jgi:hypothetical protein
MWGRCWSRHRRSWRWASCCRCARGRGARALGAWHRPGAARARPPPLPHRRDREGRPSPRRCRPALAPALLARSRRRARPSRAHRAAAGRGLQLVRGYERCGDRQPQDGPGIPHRRGQGAAAAGRGGRRAAGPVAAAVRRGDGQPAAAGGHLAHRQLAGADRLLVALHAAAGQVLCVGRPRGARAAAAAPGARRSCRARPAPGRLVAWRRAHPPLPRAGPRGTCSSRSSARRCRPPAWRCARSSTTAASPRWAAAAAAAAAAVAARAADTPDDPA